MEVISIPACIKEEFYAKCNYRSELEDTRDEFIKQVELAYMYNIGDDNQAIRNSKLNSTFQMRDFRLAQAKEKFKKELSLIRQEDTKVNIKKMRYDGDVNNKNLYLGFSYYIVSDGDGNYNIYKSDSLLPETLVDEKFNSEEWIEQDI